MVSIDSFAGNSKSCKRIDKAGFSRCRLFQLCIVENIPKTDANNFFRAKIYDIALLDDVIHMRITSSVTFHTIAYPVG